MKRARTKPKTEKPSSSSMRNIATQTVEFDTLAEIAKLQEQVKLLQLENDVLKQHTKTPENSDITTKYRQLYTHETIKKSNAAADEKRCSCKGNCSTRVCGCVKRSNKCNPSCKCNNKTCQNKKIKHENKENIHEDYITPKKHDTRSEAITKKFTSLFSPNTPETSENDEKYKEIHKALEETQIGNITFSSNNTKDTEMVKLEVDKILNNINNVTSRRERKNKEQRQLAAKTVNDIKDTEITTNSISSKNNENIEEMFDPMKPKHQLSRTPPNSKKVTNNSPEMGNVIQPQPHHKTNKDTMIVSSIQVSDIKEEKIDWQQHTAQLVPCKKCKRTFMPHRIQKHEACCKGI